MRTLINDKWTFAECAPGTEAEAVFRASDIPSDKETTDPPPAFRPVDLPHDWMITDVRNLYRSSVGLYQRTLVLDASRHNSVFFEGVYMRTTVFLNGRKIFFWPYGYTSFEVDLTPYQKAGENVLTLHVDYRSPNTRWYSGAGIYRDVWLLEKDPVHIPEGGVYAHTEAVEPEQMREVISTEAGSPTQRSDSSRFRITIDTEVTSPAPGADVIVRHVLRDADGNIVASSESALRNTDGSIGAMAESALQHAGGSIVASSESALRNTDGSIVASSESAPEDASQSARPSYSVNTQILQPENVTCWDIENPYLYTLETCVLCDDILRDSCTQKIGFRTILFDPDEGFFLNGRHVKIFGACMHHDLGALGAAFNKKAARRQLEKLRTLGINAIRTSHNPPAVGLMELCDEMGFLVNSDAFDMWEQPKTENDYGIFFHEWCERDVESWIRRDRNHPSVIMWSCGNEIPDTNNLSAVAIAERLERAMRRHDPRHNAYTTIASNFVAWENAQKSQDVFELSGYNYLESVYDEHHEKFPHWCIYGSETASTVQSRGIYHFPKSNRLLTYEDQQCSSLDNCSTNWGAKNVHRFITDDRDRPYSAGQFIWTGWDYIGEPTPYFSKNSFFGHIDTAGFYKDTAYILKAARVPCEKDPFVHISPYWDFNVGQMIDVDVYSNAPRVELFFLEEHEQEGEGTYSTDTAPVKIGEKLLDQARDTDFSAHFRLPYRPGVLRAVAYDNKGNIIATDESGSYGDPVSIRLAAEYDSISADGEDLQFIQISVQDAMGREVRNARNRMAVSVTGPARLVGMDNGDSTDYDEYKCSSRKLFSGKLLAILAATKEPGTVTIRVTSPGLTPAELTFPAVPAKGRDGICCSYRIPGSYGSDYGTSEDAADPPISEIRNEAGVPGEGNTSGEGYTPSSMSDEVPIRKLTLTCTPASLIGAALTPEQPSAEISARIEPANATYRDVHFKAVTSDGIESRAVKIEMLPSGVSTSQKDGKPEEGSAAGVPQDENTPSDSTLCSINERTFRIRMTAVSDGTFRLVASANNGKDHPEILSDLEFSVTGFGSATLDPYTMVHGCEYAKSSKEALLSFRGSVNFGDGNVIRFDNVDFGDYGSDELHLSLFSFRSEEPVEIRDEAPDGSELLFSGNYAVPSEYNVLQEDTFQLKKRLRGIRSLTFRFEHGLVLGGFRMTRQEKAYGLIPATEHGMITGDFYEEREDGIYHIGNNVDIEFPGMNFRDGVSGITITGRARKTVNPIHIRFFSGDTVVKQVVEFPVSEEPQTLTFPLEGFLGEGRVNFIFLPGSDFDLMSFRFEAK